MASARRPVSDKRGSISVCFLLALLRDWSGALCGGLVQRFVAMVSFDRQTSDLPPGDTQRGHTLRNRESH